MNWLAGKLSKPAFHRAFGYMQETYPDSNLTQHVASIATADNPMAPTEDEPFSAYAEAEPTGGERKSIRQRVTGAAQKRAKTYAVTKAMNLVWSQLALPLTIVLWVIKAIMSFVEDRRASAARKWKTTAAHDAEVAKVVKAVKARGKDKFIASKRPPTQSHVLRSADAKKEMGPAAALSPEGATEHPLHLIDLARLTSVISVDTETDTCVVQAGCTFRDLLRATTHHRLMPQVVPPYLNMTVGGAVIGSAIGSESWRKGTFVDGVLEMEVVLGSGELLRITRDGPHAALFHALHSSYHSLATIVSMKLQLIHAPRYVHMKYECFDALSKAQTRLTNVLKAQNAETMENVEMLVFAPKNIVLCTNTGLEAIDPKHHKVITLSSWWEQQYAYYVLAWARRTQQHGGAMPVKHCIPLMDYLQRYEHGAFWQGGWIYAMLPWPLKGNSFVTRLLVGWTMDESNIRHGVELSDRHFDFEKTRIIQDAQVPLHHLDAFLQWTMGALNVAPLWLCPVLGSPTDILAPNYVHAGSSSNSAHGFHYVNVGLYGHLGAGIDVEEVGTEFVSQVYQAGGRTMLHGHNWHSADLWSQMYDRKAYDAVRKKYGALDAYPHVYDKCALRQPEREAMRQPLEQEREHQVMKDMANEIITRKAKFWTA